MAGKDEFKCRRSHKIPSKELYISNKGFNNNNNSFNHQYSINNSADG